MSFRRSMTCLLLPFLHPASLASLPYLPFPCYHTLSPFSLPSLPHLLPTLSPSSYFTLPPPFPPIYISPCLFFLASPPSSATLSSFPSPLLPSLTTLPFSLLYLNFFLRLPLLSPSPCPCLVPASHASLPASHAIPSPYPVPCLSLLPLFLPANHPFDHTLLPYETIPRYDAMLGWIR